MKLSSFIRDNMEPILQEWEAYARTLLPAAKDMTVEQLRDHAQQMLETIATDLDTTQSNFAQKENLKAEGRTCRGARTALRKSTPVCAQKADLASIKWCRNTVRCGRACCGFGLKPRTETWEPLNSKK
jgi:hypothetical protein